MDFRISGFRKGRAGGFGILASPPLSFGSPAATFAFHFRLRHLPLVQCVYTTPGVGIHSWLQMSQWFTVRWTWLIGGSLRLYHQQPQPVHTIHHFGWYGVLHVRHRDGNETYHAENVQCR
jgi:hypothetical protein